VVALVDGALAFAPFDYEAAPPEALMAAYRAARAPFAETGSPALPQGLNLGAQLFWMDRVHPAAMTHATLVPWAQYWAWWLSGVAVSEVTSLGCHTDVWDPAAADFSSLAQREDWAGRFAPVVPAAQAIGTLRADLAARTGLSPAIRVLAGLHDSNAALHAARGFAQVGAGAATVLSTGTWFIAMRTGADPASLTDLPEARDCLVNVDCLGGAVPSARFMGGREIESLIEIDTRRVDIRPDQPDLINAVPRVLVSGAMHLPTLAPGCGPFPDHAGRWVNPPADWHERRVAACLYAALVTDTALGLVGARGTLLVEGRFAHAQVFVRALASLRPDLAVYIAHADTDVSFGALRLVDPTLAPPGGLSRVSPLDHDLEPYRNAWAAAVAAEEPV
jgi:sugar (pentulose or hexulose) kinase